MSGELCCELFPSNHRHQPVCPKGGTLYEPKKDARSDGRTTFTVLLFRIMYNCPCRTRGNSSWQDPWDAREMCQIIFLRPQQGDSANFESPSDDRKIPRYKKPAVVLLVILWPWTSDWSNTRGRWRHPESQRHCSINIVWSRVGIW